MRNVIIVASLVASGVLFSGSALADGSSDLKRPLIARVDGSSDLKRPLVQAA